ncbi:MAG: PfkB family carbohydrate kinase [Planctomycetota bacterium]
MSLLVTGSLGIDTIETPAGRRDNVIGGSATYFAYGASFFTPVRLVGAVGEDWPTDMKDVYAGRPVDLEGLEVRQGSKSFRWHGSYVDDLNNAESIQTDLNILAEDAPKIPDSYLDSEFVFLANTHPALQADMQSKLKNVRLSVADTMNLWITEFNADLRKLLEQIDGLVLNDGEARLLTGEKNMVAAAGEVLKMGPKFTVIKKGEHGCLMAWKHADSKTPTDVRTFVLPAYPTDKVVDPTGAGDTFASGMMGYLATQRSLSPATIKRALAFGTVVASYTIADFSLDALQATSREAIDTRYEKLKAAMSF